MSYDLSVGRRGAVMVVLACGCGARTGLFLAGDASIEVVDAGRDAGADARDGASSEADATPDAPPDAPVVVQAGCSDRKREGFVDDKQFPAIAGCSGGWSVPGVMPFNPGTAPSCSSVATFDTTTPACGRNAGNDSSNPNGSGCNVADLCEAGWHVCSSSDEVTTSGGCTGATQAGDPLLFFVSRQSSNGCQHCATGTLTGPSCNAAACTPNCKEAAATSNDVFGCGNFGVPGPFLECGPLDRTSNNLCTGLSSSSWSCKDDGSGLCEAYVLVHSSPASGGALCCRD